MTTILEKLQLPFGTNVYWINLKGSVDRRNRMMERLETAGWTHIAHRIEAVDSMEADNLLVDKRSFRSSRKKTVAASLISHLKAMQQALRDGCSQAIILEDNVTFDLCEDWKSSLRDMVACADSQSDILLLSWFSNYPQIRSLLRQNNSENKLWVPHKRQIFGSFVYMISKTAMENLVATRVTKTGLYDVFPPISKFGNIWTSDFMIISSGSQTKVCTIPLFGYEGFDSAIHREARRSHRENLKYIRNYVKDDKLFWGTAVPSPQKPVVETILRLESQPIPTSVVLQFENFVVRKEGPNSVRVFFVETEKLFYQYPAITEKFCAAMPVPKNCIFVHMPWATIIDQIHQKRGQTQIDVLLEQLTQTLSILSREYLLPINTVCQHVRHATLHDIWAKLKIEKVYLCHYSTEMNLNNNSLFDAVPLYAVNTWDKQRRVGIPDQLKPSESRSYLFSFIGSFKKIELNPIREKILSWKETKIPPRFFVCDTKKWFFQDLVYNRENNFLQRAGVEKSLNVQETKKIEKYNAVLCDSVFSLCPVGVGPNTIRLTESLCTGSIPVIIADEFPTEKFFRWKDVQPSDFCIQISYDDPCLNDPESFISKLETVKPQKRSIMQKKAMEIGERLFKTGLLVQI